MTHSNSRQHSDAPPPAQSALIPDCILFRSAVFLQPTSTELNYKKHAASSIQLAESGTIAVLFLFDHL